MKQYTRVSYAVRCQISAYLQTNLSIPVIAAKLGFHKATIYRELKRNGRYRSPTYWPEAAQKKAMNRIKLNHRRPVLVGELKHLVLRKLDDGWSPHLIVQRLRLEDQCRVSAETIYRFVRKNPEYKARLRWGTRRGVGRYSQRKNKLSRTNTIHDRPQIANERRRIGDWERDTMYGANRKQVLVMTDRKSRYSVLRKLPKVDSNSVNVMTLKALKNLKRKIYSITNDNGTEFRKDLRAQFPVYHCDALRPQQRGTVEHMIGNLRKWIKRDSDLEKLSTRKLKYIECLLNNRPRKCLGYRTPYEVFNNTKVALVS